MSAGGFTIPDRSMSNRGKPLAEIREHPEFVVEWDVHRDENGYAVTLDFDCQYKSRDTLPRPLTDEELIAVRRAVAVHALVCTAENDSQYYDALDDDGKFNWRSANAHKSRLLGRMIHDGMPPTRTKPPVLYAEPRWDMLPEGDPFAVGGVKHP